MEVVLVRSRAPRGVLLVFHGCMRRPTDWWHYEPTCVTCIGEYVFTCSPVCLYLQILDSPPDRCCCAVPSCCGYAQPHTTPFVVLGVGVTITRPDAGSGCCGSVSHLRG